jgi:hypothetical protein
VVAAHGQVRKQISAVSPDARVQERQRVVMRVRALIETVGATLLYLPPYWSP